MSDKSSWKTARLIPVVGIKGDREKEQRATSAFLAVLSIVRPFSHDLLTKMGASSAAKATVETFTEVKIGSGEQSVRPDGVVRVTFGSKSFTALVEVKTGDNKLDKDQINRYWQSARRAGYNRVITISNEIAPPGAHPVAGLRAQRNSPVQIIHLSWVRILSVALRLKNHTGVDDPEQAWILDELIRYLQHTASGVLPFADMGGSWRAIRDSARAGTLTRQTSGLPEVARKIDEMHEFSALRLSTEIGEDVIVKFSGATREQTPRIESFQKTMIDGGPIGARFSIPNTAGDILTEIDLRAQQLTVSVEVRAPDDRAARGRISWIVRQLGDADGQVIVEAFAKNAPIPVAARLDDIRVDRSVLLGAQRAKAHRFVIKSLGAMPQGRKSGSRTPGLVDGYVKLLVEFYESVVQNLTPWQPPPPKRKSEAKTQEADTTAENSVLSSAG